jgi:predicted tellurium resistance membrane protein TerC
MLCVAVVELSDVMFAFDSVPAIIAVSREPLIVYSAMMFAILGLRTLYFVLEALKQYLSQLEKAVIVLLFFIAFKLGLNASDPYLAMATVCLQPPVCMSYWAYWRSVFLPALSSLKNRKRKIKKADLRLFNNKYVINERG